MENARWLLALLPVLVLFVLILSGRVKPLWSAVVALALAVVLAAWPFEAPLETILLGGGKGLWLGTWILLVVIPALLLYRLAKTAGMERLGATFTRFLPDHTDRLLLLAWIFPSFIQGVAGFGTPIAICAPLLLLLGYDKVRAVVLPLVGYHWSVTFGSMGASFYMASLTADLTASAQDRLALHASGLLAVNLLVAGVLVLLIDGGPRQLRAGAVTLLTVGVGMAATLVICATAVPAVASLAAGSAGLLVLTAKRLLTARRATPSEPLPAGQPTTGPGADGQPGGAGADGQPGGASADGQPVGAGTEGQRTGRELNGEPAPSPTGSTVVLAPYAYLLLVVLPVFLIPPARRFVTELVSLAPSFPATDTGLGWVNAAIDAYLPVPVFGHPGFYIALACLLGWLTYRWAKLWHRGDGGQVLRAWLTSVRGSVPTILVLGVLAMVLVDAGMVSTLATGVADLTGAVYPALSPVVGAMGSFMTGSSTASNALFAALQAEVATLIEVPPPLLVAAQTAGANVGNAIAPVVILVGAAAVSANDQVGRIARRTLLPVGILLAVDILAVLLYLGTR